MHAQIAKFVTQARHALQMNEEQPSRWGADGGADKA
jgi:hypothetical protein